MKNETIRVDEIFYLRLGICHSGYALVSDLFGEAVCVNTHNILTIMECIRFDYELSAYGASEKWNTSPDIDVYLDMGRFHIAYILGFVGKLETHGICESVHGTVGRYHYWNTRIYSDEELATMLADTINDKIRSMR